MSGFSFKVPLRVIPVSSEVLWTSLDSLRNRLSTDVSGSDFLGRIRAYTGLLGEENRRSARLINGGVR
jgi:hypothetical protein